ncbi:MAG: hypothetical protein HY691_18555, partial [Chloroflexi bacterium]|nr:hypothetical protein [Chloroflexota bacterium]
MRTLSGALLAQQRSGGGEPAFLLRFRDRPVEFERFAWAQLFASAGSPERPHAAAVVGDGGIVRVRSRDLGGGQAAIDVCRVAPADLGGGAAVWESWTTIASNGYEGTPACPVSCAYGAAQGRVRMAYAGVDSTVLVVESSDDGRTWGSPTVAFTASAPAEKLALCAHPSLARWAIVYAGGGLGPPTLYLRYEQGSGWTDGGGTTDLGTVQAIAAQFNAYDQVRAIVAEGSYRLSHLYWVPDGPGWQARGTLLEAGADSGWRWEWPSFLTGSAVWRKIFAYVETSPLRSARRCVVALSPAEERLTDGLPLALALAPTYGLTILQAGDYYYLVGTRQAYRAPRFTGAGEDVLDVSDRLVGLRYHDPGGMRPASLRLELANDDGALSAAGQSGPFRALRPGSEVVLGLGYRLASGSEVSLLPPCYVDRVVSHRQEGRAWATVYALDAWGHLDRIRSPRELVFGTGVTAEDVATWLCGYVAADLYDFDSARMLQTFSSFVVHPARRVEELAAPLTVAEGESLGAALRRCLRAVGTYVRFWRDQDPAHLDPARATALSPTPDDASAHSYGDGQHPIGRAQYGGAGGQVVNDVEVYGEGANGQATDFAHLAAWGKHLVEKVHDRTLATADACNARAARVLEEEQR